MAKEESQPISGEAAAGSVCGWLLIRNPVKCANF